jgi:hypothetical protein
LLRKGFEAAGNTSSAFDAREQKRPLVDLEDIVLLYNTSPNAPNIVRNARHALVGMLRQGKGAIRWTRLFLSLAHARHARADQGLVADEPRRKLIKVGVVSHGRLYRVPDG